MARHEKKQSRSAKYAHIAAELKKEAFEHNQKIAKENKASPDNRLEDIINAITFDIEQFSREVEELSTIEDTDVQIKSKQETASERTETTLPVEEEQAEKEEPVEVEEKPEESTENETYEVEDSVPSANQEAELVIPKQQTSETKQKLAAIVCLVFIVLIFVGMNLYKDKSRKNEPIIVNEPTENISLRNTMDPQLRDRWLSNKAINQDYVGDLIFDSGLINVSFVQAKSIFDRNGKFYTFYTEDGQLAQEDEAEYYNGNDVYIWTNWKTGKYDNGNDEGGSVFMDFRNSMNDQNIIIYGHHFARDWEPSGKKQFTPLDFLLEEENYEANKSLKLILDNEIREYVVTNVFTIDVDDEYELNIMRRNMDEDYSGNPDPGFFENFIEYINEANRYPITESLSKEDKLLTLVTCMQHQPQYRQIVMCKETERKNFD